MSELQQFIRDQSLPPAALFASDVNADQDAPDPETWKFRELWLRVLVESVSDYLFKRCTSQDFKEAQRWIFERIPARNSFENVCDALELPANALRVQLAGLHTERATRPDRIASVMRVLHECGVRVKS